MGYVRIKQQHLYDIADAIRARSGDIYTTYTIKEMAPAIASLKSIDDNLVKIIEGTIVTYYNDRITSLGELVLGHQPHLTSVSFPNVESAGESCFAMCPLLESVSLPNLQRTYSTQGDYVGGRLFEGDSALREITFPSLTLMGNYMFQDCTSLEKVDFYQTLNALTTGCFQRCANLKAIILRGNAVTPINNAVFGYDFDIYPVAPLLPIPADVYFYVPRNLITAYEAEWASQFAERLRAIEDYPEICEVA